MQIILNSLPKISLNKWYSGGHWSKRKKIKDQYKWIIRSQTKTLISKDGKYDVIYLFEFKRAPLDASNCVAMVKLIEDIIFEDDKYNIVESITIKSRKAKKDRVIININ